MIPKKLQRVVLEGFQKKFKKNFQKKFQKKFHKNPEKDTNVERFYINLI